MPALVDQHLRLLPVMTAFRLMVLVPSVTLFGQKRSSVYWSYTVIRARKVLLDMQKVYAFGLLPIIKPLSRIGKVIGQSNNLFTFRFSVYFTLGHCMRIFGVLKVDQAGSIGIARFDLSIFIEKGIPFPVMHRSLKSLETISAGTGLVVEPLLGDASNDAVRVRGNFCNYNELQIDSVWVKASSSKYRKALQQRNFNAGLIDSRLPSDLHADHVVNRASLNAMIQKNHEPWVLMFEVPSSANTNFGSQYEKYLPPVPPDTGQLFLTPAQIFKLYTTDWPKNSDEFQMSLKKIADQVNNPEVIRRIREEFEEKFQ